MKLLYPLIFLLLSCSTEPEDVIVTPTDFEEGVISVTLQSTSVDIGGTLDISWNHYVQTDSLEFYTVGDSVQISIYKESQEVHQIEGWIKESWESTTSNYGGYSLNILDWGLGADFRIKIVDEFGNFGYSELFSISNFTTETDLAVLQDFIDANNLYPSDSPTYEPEEIGSQTWSNGRLKSLDFSHYSWDIDSLPSSIGNLSMLTSLDLESNDLRTLPDELCNIASNLQTFELRNNRICPPYPECIDSTILISQYQYNCTDIGCNDTTSCTYDSTVTHSYLETTCEYLDCSGVCSGNALTDNCGVCDDDNQNDCVQDCLGVWGGNAVFDNCLVCDEDSSNDCIQDCDGVWGGNTPDEDNDNICDWNDGDSYTSIEIGSQVWMQENLRVTKFKNGDDINFIYSDNWWYIDYDDYGVIKALDPDNREIDGHLYNGFTANDERGICPDGWHIPSRGEWNILINFLGGTNLAGGKIKYDGFEYWNTPNTGATNESGFNAVGAGTMSVYSWEDEGYAYQNNRAYFWSSTITSQGNGYRYYDTFMLFYNSSEFDNYEKVGGNLYSVRCLKD
jgi:uncharacterized protein (TIGR02145 family)